MRPPTLRFDPLAELSDGVLTCPRCGTRSVAPPHELKDFPIDFPCEVCHTEFRVSYADNGPVTRVKPMKKRNGKRVDPDWDNRQVTLALSDRELRAHN